ncbi:putative pectin methylesterase cgr3 [Asimina triloba]
MGVPFFSLHILTVAQGWEKWRTFQMGAVNAAFTKIGDLTNDSDVLCTTEVQRAIPILSKAYGESIHKVLHVGPDTCALVSKLLKEEDTEAWGIEPYDLEDVDGTCKSLVRKGFVRVADIKFPLPYKENSFSLVIVSDALDYLSPRYLNKTLPDLARVARDGLVIFAGFPGQQRAKSAELLKYGKPAKLRSSSWWIRYFVQTSLEENEGAAKKFEQAATKKGYKPNCQMIEVISRMCTVPAFRMVVVQWILNKNNLKSKIKS